MPSDNYKASVSPPSSDRKAYNGFKSEAKPSPMHGHDPRYDPRHDRQFVPS